ncbi:MAG: hypothetical protein IPJ82_07575 [Lewinellaceae bacterium]|nr:hypothetical protein [Lewinellaceae bacterium]
MKAISFLQSLPVFFLSFLTGIYLHAQTTPDLQAIAVDGQITLRVKNTAVLDTLFYVDTDNKVILDFYFGPDDSRNGTYSANPVAQSFGEQHLSFASIPYTTGDTLSFSVMETMPDNTAREYLFIEGVYVRSAGEPIDVCPVSLECIGTWWNFFIRFNPSDIQIDLTTLANTTVYIYSPGSSINGYYQPGGVSFSKNALVFKSLPCESVLSGEIIIMINGLTCIFQNGQLVSNDTSCSPWGDFYSDNKPCAPYFENCPEEIMELLSDNKYTLPCRQWIDKNNCNTGVLINRTGKVAIGTSGFSSSF